jgi:uncharacterized membrane protein
VRKVARPADEVFEFLADASNNPRWQNGMRSCRWETDGAIEVGSRYRQEASFMGRPVCSLFEVTEYESGRRIAIETIESTFPISVERRVDATDTGSSRITATIDGGPRVPRFLAGAVQAMAQRSVDRDYDRLVTLLEGD